MATTTKDPKKELTDAAWTTFVKTHPDRASERSQFDSWLAHNPGGSPFMWSLQHSMGTIAKKPTATQSPKGTSQETQPIENSTTQPVESPTVPLPENDTPTPKPTFGPTQPIITTIQNPVRPGTAPPITTSLPQTSSSTPTPVSPGVVSVPQSPPTREHPPQVSPTQVTVQRNTPPPPVSISAATSPADREWENIKRLRPELAAKKDTYLAWRSAHPGVNYGEWVFEEAFKATRNQAAAQTTPPTQPSSATPPPKTPPPPGSKPTQSAQQVTSTLWGTVRDLSGEIILAGTLYIKTNGKILAYPLSFLYDNKINLPPGKYEVKAEAAGFRIPEQFEWVTNPGGFTLQLFPIKHGSHGHQGHRQGAHNGFSGRAINSDHLPLPGMEVRILIVKEDKTNDEEVEKQKEKSGFSKIFKTKKNPRTGEYYKDMQRVTDAKGQFYTATYLPPGVYRISCEDPTQTYTFGMKTVRVTDNHIHPIDMVGFSHDEQEKKKKKISGHAADKKLKPLSGIAITIKVISMQALSDRHEKLKGLKARQAKMMRSGSFYKSRAAGMLAAEKRKINNSLQNSAQVLTYSTDKLGNFTTGMQELPDGRYIVTASDPKGTYRFDKKSFTLTNAATKSVSFTGLTQKEKEEQKQEQQKEEEQKRKDKEKQKEVEEKNKKKKPESEEERKKREEEEAKKKKKQDENPNSLRNRVNKRFQTIKEKITRPFKKLGAKMKQGLKKLVPKKIRDFFGKMNSKGSDFTKKLKDRYKKFTDRFKKVTNPAQAAEDKAKKTIFNSLKRGILRVGKAIGRMAMRLARMIGRLALRLARVLGRLAIQAIRILARLAVQAIQMLLRLAVMAVQALVQAVVAIVETVVSAVQAVVAAVVANPIVLLIILGVVLTVLTVYGLIHFVLQPLVKKVTHKGGSVTTGRQLNQDQIPGLTIKKSGPEHVDNGQDITYTINVTYKGDLDVTISDTIPKNVAEIKTVSPIGSSIGNAPVPACTFTRGGQSAPYQSGQLWSYFEAASQKTKIPAALLAAFARVESTTDEYSISNYSDSDLQAMTSTDNLNNLSSNIDLKIGTTTKSFCPASPTGALGIMQLEPPDGLIATLKSPKRTFAQPGAYDPDAIQNGADLLGLNGSNLTIQDYCNPQKNIMLAAGFILKKLQYKGYGDGKSWDPAWNTNPTVIDALARSYYGALNYDFNGHTYSYGDDLYNGLNSCTNSQVARPDTSGDATNGNTVSWKLKELGKGPDYTFTITVHPLKDDTVITNSAVASAPGGGTSGPPPDVSSADYEKVFTNQGRNTTILGDENNFVAKVIQNGAPNQDSILRAIYKNSVAKNVNPLLIVALWGEESGYANGTAGAFGCLNGSTAMEAQIACAVNTMDFWMKGYEQGSHTIPVQAGDPSPGPGCSEFTDPLLYALEWYGPVCHHYDHNENFHANITSFFKRLYGGGAQ